MSKLTAKLRAANKKWKGGVHERADSEPDYTDLPDSIYLAKVIGAELGESESSGRLQIAWQFKVLQGEFEGETIRDYEGLDTDDNLFYLGRKIARLGYELPEDLAEDLEGLLEEIIDGGPVVKLRLKTKGEFQNTFIQKLVEGGGSEEDEGEEDVDEAGEDVPAGDEDEAGGDEDEWEEGMSCMAPFDGQPFEATIISIEDETATVEDEEGEQWDVPLVELDEVEEETGEEETGEEETGEEEIDLEKGMNVEAEDADGEEVSGTVTFISKDGTTCSVKDEEGTLHRKIPVENISSVVKDEVPDTPATKPTSGRRSKASKVTKKKGSRSTR